jgi:superfamily II DNA or RNA helicase
MPAHDIIDNRNEKLVDHIRQILDSSEAARFAVGYFFLSGLEAIGDKLDGVRELRLLIGNTTNRETLEQLSEGYRRLELVADEMEEQSYPQRAKVTQMVGQTGQSVRQTMELMDQTDEGEAVIRTLVRLIEERRLQVRVYTKGRLHAKAYIFDYGAVYDQNGKQVDRHEKGIAVVGSSNLTLSGVTHNTELNVVVQGNDNHAELVRWFEELWAEAVPFDEPLMQEMQQSWAAAVVTPYDIYMKTLYELVRDRLEGEDEQDVLWDDEIITKLADFQKVAVRQSVQMIRSWGGAFVADVVGMGKSYVGAAVVKHFHRTNNWRTLIICPAPLVEMWERYNQVYDLGAVVLSSGYLREQTDRDGGRVNLLMADEVYRDRDLVLIDESHNFRYSATQRYQLVQEYVSTGRHCCFLTATPRNKTAWDVYHQIKLFHPDDRTDLPVDPPDLRQYFREVEHGEKSLPELLSHVLMRRTRNHILRWYGFDSETHQPVDPTRFDEYRTGRRKAYIMVAGRHQFFPKRELGTIDYSIEDTYGGLYQELRGYLGKARRGLPKEPLADQLTYARYGLWHYVSKAKQKREPYVSLQRAGANLCGLMRVLLFKRFESSVFAFSETTARLQRMHGLFLTALDEGIVAAGEEAQRLLYESDFDEEQELLDALREVTGRYSVADFDVDRLRRHVEHDIHLLGRIHDLVAPITPEMDDKLQTLRARLAAAPLAGGKVLIFTQFADTARYLYDNLNPGDALPDVEVIYSGDKSKAKVVGRFAPRANPEYQKPAGETEIQTLIATDVLAEGLNLQDCDNIVNYDLHWNPVRLIQRFGRIDRIGSEHEVVYGFNFLPETGIERNLGLTQKLANRIREIHETIGEDSAILDPSEQLNEEAMYAIYERQGEQLSLFEDEEEEQLVDLNEAEELLRLLRKEHPEEYDRIADLRDGIRTGRPSEAKGLYVFCAAGRFQQLVLVDQDGVVTSREVGKVLGAIKCGRDMRSAPLPSGHNAAVMRVKRAFAEDVKHREVERQHTASLGLGQRYVLRELRVLFGAARDEDLKGQIRILEQAFSGPITAAVNRELNLLRRNGVASEDLLRALGRIYQQHDLRRAAERAAAGLAETPIPRIVCSEGLV